MRRLFAILSLALIAACGGQEPTVATTTAAPALKTPSNEEAAKLISNSPEFSDYHFTYSSFSLPMDRKMMNEPTLKSAEELAAAGWLKFDPDGTVILSDKAYNDKRFVVRPNGFTDVVPLARKEFGAVTAVRSAAEGKVHAEFTFRWLPNEVGVALKSGLAKERFEREHKARATLYDAGGEWGVLIIDPVEP